MRGRASYVYSYKNWQGVEQVLVMLKGGGGGVATSFEVVYTRVLMVLAMLKRRGQKVSTL